MELTLRDYQNEAITAVHEGWKRGLNRIAVELPTGSGKTVIFAHMARLSHDRGMKPVVLVHRDELVNQAVKKLHGAMPDAVIGRVKAQHNDVSADVIVASVQTLSRVKRRDQLTNVGMLIVDEAHHALAKTYGEVMRHYGSYAEGHGLPTSGWSATLARGDGKGLGTVWQEVVYERDILWMIDQGHLVDVKGVSVTVEGLNLGEVARSHGDMMESDLGKKMMETGAGEHIAKAYAEHAGTRQGVLFAPTVETAVSFGEDLNTVGIKTETILGVTDLETRGDIYERYVNGTTQVLSNCMVLTEGWDMPQAEVAVIARPTESKPLFIQMAGRVLRPFPGKGDALILDVVGVAGRHQLASVKDLSKYEPQEGETIKEARERLEKEQGVRGAATGTQHAVEVDLFKQSRSAWLRTYSGIYFIPTKQSYFLLWPRPGGGFWVGHTPNNTTRGAQWLIKDNGGIGLDMAMAWAEQAATKEDPSVSSRSAPWRKKSQAPSEAQVRFATGVNIPVQGKTKGQLSDDLSIWSASRLLDPVPGQ